MTFGCWCAAGNEAGRFILRGEAQFHRSLFAFMKRSQPSRSDIIFITGTDTGVGKTVLTALLLQRLRMNGIHALAMKPFCTGPRDDVEILRAIQGDELPDRLLNPFYYPEPVAPWWAAKNRGKSVRLPSVISRINEAKRRCQLLLVEGAGGLLSPLGSRFTALNLIAELGCEVVVVASNRVGCINQLSLVVHALANAGVPAPHLVLMEQQSPDESAPSNQAAMRLWSPQIPIVTVPFFGTLRRGSRTPKALSKDFSKKLLHNPAMVVELAQFFGAMLNESRKKLTVTRCGSKSKTDSARANETL